MFLESCFSDPETSARSAKMPPSPRLSACMINIRYLMVTTMVKDHAISESTPRTFVGVGLMACMP